MQNPKRNQKTEHKILLLLSKLFECHNAITFFFNIFIYATEFKEISPFQTLYFPQTAP